MGNPMAKQSWSPYLVGLGIGVLSWFAFWSANHPIGITSGFEHTSALVIKTAAPGLAESNSNRSSRNGAFRWTTTAGSASQR